MEGSLKGYGGVIMEIILGIISLFVFYAIIQTAIDRSINTKILKENYKILAEIRDILKNQDKNSQ
jgi:multisubunit Na+/H+ antiporter MnhB subunit